MVEVQKFDTLHEEEINLYRISNKTVAYVEILNYGGIIRSICIPDKNGMLVDVVIGFETINDYIKAESGYFGAIVGRCANRIKNASFTLNNKTYRLAKNDGNNHLHGGYNGFDKRIWDVEILAEGNGIKLSLLSKDMDENYPGNLNVSVKYMFDDMNALTIHYEAWSDADTILNLTNHAYFNLGGHNSGHIGQTFLKINADSYLPSDDELIPIGFIDKVEGTVFDFRNYRKIYEGLESKDPQILLARGYDHNFVLDKSQGDFAASCYNEATGIRLDCYTDMPGIQLYTGNFIDIDFYGKESYVYKRQEGFCLETQYFPNSINNPEWIQPILRKNEKYDSTTRYIFSTI
ncbi:MAG TPA: aldose epimerase family protein [Clostridia bacterium]|mgnify:CR=1 FL=1|nr:aldose epimerase family protein [Clostridia bacterium]